MNLEDGQYFQDGRHGATCVLASQHNYYSFIYLQSVIFVGLIGLISNWQKKKIKLGPLISSENIILHTLLKPKVE